MKNLLLIIMLFVLASCATTHTQEPVIIERVKTDTLYQKQVQRDSIYVLDSIMIIERNDTVYMNRWHNSIKYIERIDTLREIKIDSIPVVTEVTKYKTISKWRIWLSNITLFALIIGALMLFMKLLPKKD